MLRQVRDICRLTCRACRTLERERTAPSVLGMVRQDAPEESKKKTCKKKKKKLPWAPSEVRLVFAQLMAIGAPRKSPANTQPTKSNYACEDFYLTPEQWAVKAGADLHIKTAADVHQFVLQLLDAAAQVTSNSANSSATATSPTPGSSICITAVATTSAPEAEAGTQPPPAPVLTKINISRVRLKQLASRVKLLHEFRCKVLSRPEAALLRNLRNVKHSKIKKSKLAPKWWSLRHDVKLLLGKAACLLIEVTASLMRLDANGVSVCCRSGSAWHEVGRAPLQRASKRPTRDALQHAVPFCTLQNRRQSVAQDEFRSLAFLRKQTPPQAPKYSCFLPGKLLGLTDGWGALTRVHCAAAATCRQTPETISRCRARALQIRRRNPETQIWHISERLRHPSTGPTEEDCPKVTALHPGGQ